MYDYNVTPEIRICIKNNVMDSFREQAKSNNQQEYLVKGFEYAESHTIACLKDALREMDSDFLIEINGEQI